MVYLLHSQCAILKLRLIYKESVFNGNQFFGVLMRADEVIFVASFIDTVLY